jgi:hypothetical protein
MFSIRNGFQQGNPFSPLLFSFAKEYAVRRVQKNQDSLKLNGTHQLSVYADGVNILGVSVHTIKNAGAGIVANKLTGLDANAAGRVSSLGCRTKSQYKY